MYKVLVALSIVMFALASNTPALAQFADTGQINDEIDRGDPSIVAWATGVADFTAGPVDYQDPSLGTAAFGLPTDVLGPAGSSFSLGDGGHASLTFDVPIGDGPGSDFVVFENAFAFQGDVFMELGFVEVSSDGVSFARMPSICRLTTQMGSFDGSDPTNFYNLAGNFVGGTGFDLGDLLATAHPLVVSGVVRLDHISHVRIVDVIGHIDNPLAPSDWFATPVSDPYPTAFASGGMDLTGVGVIHLGGTVPTPEGSWGSVKSLFGSN